MPASPESPPEKLAALQKRFSDHIRDPDRNPAPEGIEDRRMAIYRRLFFNNLSGLFGKNFATARKIIPESAWNQLIRAFMVEHRPTTPLFPEIGREFVRFLADHLEHYEQWPWLAELCHWQVLATSVRNDNSEPNSVAVEPDGDLMADRPLLNPTLRLAQYQWPVHQIRKGRVPDRPKATLLAVWRLRDDRIGRLQINPVTARMLERLQENVAASGHVVLNELAAELAHPDPAALLEHGRALLESLRAQDVLLGTEIRQR
ncbi:MAG: DUF2063 domain-containing protein [Gammaproteobacteria bacterium HGW-Gammaproteobacteria-8]|nr:MAG: DUF2063 domain-containing protein [Gammaproteobacteria bacterium HGW-Gammaproteobacteria-8]